MGVLLLMKQTCSILSTYTADVSGVCSALYEMGGMTVMHDASGCNSTYNTHDEPRWYDMPSMVFLSALWETEAMLGDESRNINDIAKAALELKPRFIAVAGTPIPMMMGTDFHGLAKDIEAKCGIPTFGFSTNGMHSYDHGAGMAMAAVAERFCERKVCKRPLRAGEKPSVNLLGVTPLDFSVTGNVEALKKIFADNGYRVQSCWAMGSSWEELMSAGLADVNIVCSSAGLPLAKVFQQLYGTPFVSGLPIGRKVTQELFASAELAAAGGAALEPEAMPLAAAEKTVCVVGESVCSTSLARALALDFGVKNARAVCPLEFPDEDAVFAELRNAAVVVADPLYKPALPKEGCRFISLPHEGYSGRIFRRDIPVYIGEGFNSWMTKEIQQ